MKKNLIKLCLAAILSALAVVLVINLRVILVPIVHFLEYDPADIPIFIATVLLGPGYGIGMTIAVSILQGVTVSAESGWIGILMHILATGSAVAVLGFITRKIKSDSRVLIGLSLGSLFMVITMFLWNLLFTPYFMEIPLSKLLPLMPYIVLFNVLKAVINSILAFVLYKATFPAFKKYCKM